MYGWNVLCTHDGAERFAHGAVHLEREVQCSLIEEDSRESEGNRENVQIHRQTDRDTQTNTLTVSYSYIRVYKQSESDRRKNILHHISLPSIGVSSYVLAVLRTLERFRLLECWGHSDLNP